MILFRGRKAKLFYVSTTAVTSSITAATVCYKSSTAAMAACKRKKRSFLTGQIPEIEKEIVPSTLDSSFIEDDVFDKDHRDPKFLVYWLTTTS